MDAVERDLFAQTLRKTMTAASGRALDTALADLGWSDLLTEVPDVAVPLAFGLLGETGAHAPLLNDVLLHAAGRAVGAPAPAVHGRRVGRVGAHGRGGRHAGRRAAAADRRGRGSRPARRGTPGARLVAPGHRPGDARARPLARARPDPVRPSLASFQAVRHRLAETSSRSTAPRRPSWPPRTTSAACSPRRRPDRQR